MAVRCREVGGGPTLPAMALNLDLINAALTRTGNDPITELNDGTPGGNIAGANYDQIVRAALTGYPWRWATKTQVLVAITGDPDPPWLYAYQLPTDLLKLRVVTAEGLTFDYERQFNKLLCDVGTDIDLIAKYTWNVPESYWPATFAEALTQQLEALFLRGIGERYDEATDRSREARATMSAAKLEDAQNNSARNPVTSPTLAARGATGFATSALTARTG
jgi:hypothetical protein